MREYLVSTLIFFGESHDTVLILFSRQSGVYKFFYMILFHECKINERLCKSIFPKHQQSVTFLENCQRHSVPIISENDISPNIQNFH